MPEARGKVATYLTKADFEQHVAQWHDEFSVLRHAHVMPHFVVVFSRVGWPSAWKASHPKHHGDRLGVVEFEANRREAPHHLNRVVLDARGHQHQLLLVRLRHPSRAAKKGARWLVSTDAFAYASRRDWMIAPEPL